MRALHSRSSSTMPIVRATTQVHYSENHNLIRIYAVQNAKWETPYQSSPDLPTHFLSCVRISFKPFNSFLYFMQEFGTFDSASSNTASADLEASFPARYSWYRLSASCSQASSASTSSPESRERISCSTRRMRSSSVSCAT